MEAPALLKRIVIHQEKPMTLPEPLYEEPTLPEVLIDPIIMALMRYDSVREEEISLLARKFLDE